MGVRIVSLDNCLDLIVLLLPWIVVLASLYIAIPPHPTYDSLLPPLDLKIQPSSGSQNLGNAIGRTLYLALS